jgi:hypothetical protein
MDVLELCPGKEEMEEFEEEERDEEWPEGGMRCPVAGCPSEDHWFGKIAGYWAHYHRFYHCLVTLFQCPRCRTKDIKLSEVRRHLRKVHHTSSENGVTRETVVNTKYVNPKGFRRPTPKIHREERDRAQEERWRNLPSAPLFHLSSDHNPRDEKCPVGGGVKK